MTMAQHGYSMVTSEALANWQKLELPIEENGYIYIYVANESVDNVNVYFDDLEVILIESPVTNASDYYPFGLTMNGRSWSSERYRFGYQGQFAEKDEETGWNSFELRMYAPVIGRWMSVNPYGQFYSPYLGMCNNSIYYIDRDGGCVGDDCADGNVKRNDNWDNNFEAYVLEEVEVSAFRKLDGILGRVVDIWERKGYTIYDKSTYGNLNWDQSNLKVRGFPFEGLGMSLSGILPNGGVIYSIDEIYTKGDGKNDTYFTFGYGYGIDVSIDGHLTTYNKRDNSPLLSRDIAGWNVFYSYSYQTFTVHKGYSISLKSGVGNTQSTSYGVQIGPTTPLIFNGYAGVGYTINLSALDRWAKSKF